MKLTKKEVVTMLAKEIASQVGSDNRKLRLKGRINETLLEMVKNAKLETYKNLAFTQNGVLNKGYIMEDLVLDFKQAEKETEYLEVKYFGNDTPNILINNETRLVYIVINKATLKGAFTIRNMKALRNKRIGLNYLLENDLLQPCTKLNDYLGLTA